MTESRRLPSFGAIGWSRVQGGTGNLFGSAVNHLGHVIIRISEARIYEDRIGGERVSADKLIAEVAMSESQFASFITQPNMGHGVACTLRAFRDGEHLTTPPEPPREESVHARLQADADRAVGSQRERAERAVRELRALVGDRIPKVKQREFEILLGQISTTMEADIRYARQTMEESAEHLTQRIRTEVEAGIQGFVTRLGVEALTERMQAMLPDLTAKDGDS